MSSAPVDPRTKIEHDVQIGQVYRDSRTNEPLVLVYLDRDVYLLRDKDGNHRTGTRRELDVTIGADRYKLDAETEPWGNTGLLQRVLERAAEYDSEGGRKQDHYAKAMREAVEILKDTGAADAHETVDFESIDRVGEKTANRLRAAGYRTRQDVRRASDAELLDVTGVGASSLENIRGDVQ